MSAYRRTRKEKTNAYRKAWYAARVSERRAYARGYYVENQPHLEEARRRRRARKRENGVFKVSEHDWQRLCARHNHACAYCKAKAPLERDHIIPITRGGAHSIGNLLPACRSCNASKGDKFLTEWRSKTYTGR